MRNGYELKNRSDPEVLRRLLSVYERGDHDDWLAPTGFALIALMLPVMSWARWPAVTFTVAWSALLWWQLATRVKDRRKEIQQILYLNEPDYESSDTTTRHSDS